MSASWFQEITKSSGGYQPDNWTAEKIIEYERNKDSKKSYKTLIKEKKSLESLLDINEAYLKVLRMNLEFSIKEKLGRERILEDRRALCAYICETEELKFRISSKDAEITKRNAILARYDVRFPYNKLLHPKGSKKNPIKLDD